jgi:hypothetical protein
VPKYCCNADRVGTALLRQLAQIAQDNGIEHLAAQAASVEV